MKNNFKTCTSYRLVALLLLTVMMMATLPPAVFSVAADEDDIIVSDYDSLVLALKNASALDRIVVVSDITIPAGKTLSVPKGVRLIIAYNKDGEFGGHTAEDYSSSSVNYTESFESDNAVYTLTVEKGATVNVYGSLYVGGQLVSASSKPYQGATGKVYSKLVCDGEVNFIDGTLYCYGYIEGEGNVNTSGASGVYAPFVIGNFNGGGYIYGLYKVGNISPLNEYIMPNIKASLTVNYGSSVYGLCALYSGGAVNVSTPKLVGNTEALIILGSGSRVVSRYCDNQSEAGDLTGKLCLDFYGNITAGALYMEIYYTPISTADVVFPIPYGLDVTVKEGVFSTSKKFALLPGANLTVEKGGSISLEKSGGLYVVEGICETKNFSAYYPYAQELIKNGYTPTASLTVEGKVEVKSGAAFAGTVTNVKPGAVIAIDTNAILTGKYVSGMAGSYNVNFNDYAYYNKTEYSLTAKALSVTGKLFNLQKGKTYYSANPGVSLEVDSFDYLYYGTKQGAAVESKKGFTDYTVTGSLNTFAVVYNYNDGSVKESTSTTIAANTAGHVWYDMYTNMVVTSISSNAFYMLGEAERYATFVYNGEQVSLVLDKEGKLLTPDFKKEHYVLDGWSTSEGGQKVYSVGEKVDFGFETLYPVWKAVKYTVKYTLTPENYQYYGGAYLYIDAKGNYVIKEEAVEYNTAAKEMPGAAIMGRDQLYFEWKGNLEAVSGNITVFGEYFEYGVRNMRTGVVHTSLASAIENAKNGDVLRIQQTTEESVEIPAGLEVTIDLNGFELFTSNPAVIVNNGQLTICDSGENGKISQNGKGIATDVYYAIVNNSDAKLVIDGAAVAASGEGSYTRAIYNQGTVEFNEGVISSENGYAVYNCNMADDDGIFVQNGGQINYCGTDSSCYGVYNYSQAKYTLNDGSVNAVNGGKAFYNGLNAVLDINGGVISSTTGGVLYNNGAKVNMYGGTITTQAVLSNLYVVSSVKYSVFASEFNMYGGTIVASNGCKGVQNQRSSFNMYGGEVTCSGKTNYSYGINNDVGSTLNVYGGKVYSASSHAIYNYATAASTAPVANIYGGHIISEGGKGYYAVITGDKSKYGIVNVNGGNFASNADYAIFAMGTNAKINIDEQAFGGLYKYNSGAVNSYTCSDEFEMVAVNTTGAYSGYYCMTSPDKALEAFVGEKEYQYVSHALAEAVSGQTVELFGDVVLNGTAYPEGIIDLLGNTLDLGANTLVADVVYIKDTIGGGIIKGYTNEEGYSHLLYTGEAELVDARMEDEIFLGYSVDGSTNYITTVGNRGKIEIYPVFASDAIFNVEFRDDEGNVIFSGQYGYGEEVTAPEGPVKAGDKVFNYIFIGWNEAVESPCYSNKVYTPLYSAEYIKYNVSFYNYDGSLIYTVVLHYGDTVTAPVPAEKQDDENYMYSFEGFTDGKNLYSADSIPEVSGNADYTASFKATAYRTESEYNVRLSSATVVFESSMTINFRAKLADVKDYDRLFVVFERHYANKDSEITVEWDYKINGNYVVFEYNNIAAKEMGDAVNATLFAIKDGVKYSYNKVEYSILKYATSLLNKSTTEQKFKTVLVDMLNYGSAAQIYFDYNADNLVNSGLTAEQKEYASWDGVSEMPLNTVKSYVPLENETARIRSISLVFVEAVTTKYQFDLSKYTGDITKLSFVVDYTNSLGNKHRKVYTFEDFEKNGNYYTVEFADIATKDMSVAFTGALYSEYGTEDQARVSGIVTYSIESYAYSMSGSGESGIANLVKSMMAFGNSARAYFAE